MRRLRDGEECITLLSRLTSSELSTLLLKVRPKLRRDEGYDEDGFRVRRMESIVGVPSLPLPTLVALLTAAATELRHSVQTDYVTGETYVSDERTSTYCVVAQREVPSVVARLEALCRLPASHFERLKLVRYGPGERFAPHWDGYVGPRTSSGFVQSSRLVTAFVYLATVPPGGGGETRVRV